MITSDELMQAVFAGDSEAVEKLASQLEEHGARGQKAIDQALLASAASGRTECVAALLAKASEEVFTAGRKTPLHHAAASGSAACVELLARLGPLDQRDDKGLAALHYSASSRAPEAARVLMVHGASPNAPDRIGMAPLHYAAQEEGNAACILALLERADPNASGRDGITPLMVAAKRRRHDAIEALLAHGADPQRIDGNGHDALMFSIYAMDEVGARLLVEKADLEHVDDKGLSARDRAGGVRMHELCGIIDSLHRSRVERSALEKHMGNGAMGKPAPRRI
jgi:ankyrin repeat protein